MLDLESENSSLIQQVHQCHEEEELLTKQLAFLNEKFTTLEKTLEAMLQKEKETQLLTDISLGTSLGA